MNQISDTYSSRDFYLSAYLIAAGDDLKSYQKDEVNMTIFVFRSSPDLREHVREFYALKALVNPIAYGNALRSLKSMIHSTGTKPNNTYVEQSRKPE